MFFSVEEAKFLKKLVRVREAHQYSEAHVVKGQEETRFWRAATSMYQHRLGRAFFVERAAEAAHGGYAVLKRLRKFAKTPDDIVRYPDYPDTPANSPLKSVWSSRARRFRGRTNC